MSIASALAGLALQVDQPARLFLVHPVTRDNLRFAGVEGPEGAAWIDLLSNASAAAREHDRRMNDRNLRNAQNRRRLTSADMEKDMVDKLTALTVGWHLCTLTGEPIDLPFTKDAAAEVFATPEVSWIRDQASEFLMDLGNFPRTASKNLKPLPDSNSA